MFPKFFEQRKKIMARTNVKTVKPIASAERLAGGMGAPAANQGDLAQLRRAVLTCLLWEDNAYEDGISVADNIKSLVPKVKAEDVAALAVEARFSQKLRHVPLLLAREMARHVSHRPLVADTLSKVVHRPDELSEFLSLYWKEGKCPLAKSVKIGLAKAFGKFDEYQLSKWNKDKDINLRDVMRLVHPAPKDNDQAALWGRLINGKLATADTWEVGLSAAKAGEKVNVWTRLINENKLGANAVLKNLRNMQNAGVPRELIIKALENANPAMLLPVDFFNAAQHAPDYTRHIEGLMFKCMATMPKLPGWTIMVVDVSGSMGQHLSSKSVMSRMDAAASMAVMAAEVCEDITIYATAGSDGRSIHSTKKITPSRGFALAKDIVSDRLGGGGIFTRQCLEYIREKEKGIPDRIIVFSDSQDCDRTNRTPAPFAKTNYIVDVSPHRNGVNYRGRWTAEIAGWSESFLRFIAEKEKLDLQ